MMAKIASVLLATTVALGSASAQEEGPVLAWHRFDDTGQSYRGEPYAWLGDADIDLVIDVTPGPGQSLEFYWGAKGDVREAQVGVRGAVRTLRHGGWDGFEWVRLPLPDDGVAPYTVELRRTFEAPAFFADVRLRGASGAPVPEAVEQDRRSFRITVQAGRPTTPEAFVEMRAVWDREPPPPASPLAGHEVAFRQAERNGRLANEQFFRCSKFVEGWLRHADPETGLIPRNLGPDRDLWNAQDSAADNYPFMVLTASLTDRPLFEGRMLDMLHTETALTSRIDRLPDTWSFSRRAFRDAEPNLGQVIFGASEYVKDGLMPLTEWLGESPWSARMLGIVDDIWEHAPVATEFGDIPSTNVEVNGEMLQVLSRLYWMTGEDRYLDFAVRLGDYYLLGGHHPTLDSERLRLRDHGCEIVSGLTELYVAVHFARPEKSSVYHQPIHALCDRVLEVGRNPHGMLYDSIDPKSGSHSGGICDTWGYNYNGIYAVHLVDGTEAYRDAVRRVLGNLGEYRDHHWGSADEYADSIEGAINLYNRERVPAAAAWIDSEIRDMWRVQRPDGVLEGWHGDGNSARTAIMYALWKTQGVTVRPFRMDLRFGAVREGDVLLLSLLADEAWEGEVVFDRPRHRQVMHLPLDYPRINQFPEWFVADRGARYLVSDLTGDTESVLSGGQLQGGARVRLAAAQERRIRVTRVAGGR